MFLCLSLFVFSFQTFAQKNKKPEKVKAVKTISGKFINFEMGDYVHANIKKTGGKIKSFTIGNYGLDYFLVEYKSKPMSFTYEIVDAYIPEAGGNMTIERLKSAKFGTLTFESWIKQLEKKYTYEQIEKKYEALVDKYTK
jgi:hypothetical protein